MAKLRVMAVLVLVAFLAMLSEASIYRTIITTTVEEANQGSQECMEQVQPQTMQELQHCQSYLMSPILGMQHLRPCCRALRNIDMPSCRCQALNEMMMQQGQRQQAEAMMEKAKYLPQMCSLGHQC